MLAKECRSPCPRDATQPRTPLRAPQQLVELPWTQTRAVLVHEHELALVPSMARSAPTSSGGERHGTLWRPLFQARDLPTARRRLTDVNHP